MRYIGLSDGQKKIALYMYYYLSDITEFIHLTLLQVHFYSIVHGY